MTEQMEKVEEVVKKTEEVTEEAEGDLLIALGAVESALQGTRECLDKAVHKAKEAVTIIRLLKHQVKTLRSSIKGS